MVWGMNKYMVLLGLFRKKTECLLLLGVFSVWMVGCQKAPAVSGGNAPIVEKPCCTGGHGTSHGAAGHSGAQKSEVDQKPSKT